MARIVKNAAIVVKDEEQLEEGLRSTAGLLIENHTASLIVLDLVINASDQFKDNLEFLKEMDGLAYSNVQANVDNLGFEYLSDEEIVQKLREQDVVIPF
jgi:hypothetical protein